MYEADCDFVRAIVFSSGSTMSQTGAFFHILLHTACVLDYYGTFNLIESDDKNRQYIEVIENIKY